MTHNPKVVFILETLLASKDTAIVVNRLGFSCLLHLSPFGKWGDSLLCINQVLTLILYIFLVI